MLCIVICQELRRKTPTTWTWFSTLGAVLFRDIFDDIQYCGLRCKELSGITRDDRSKIDLQHSWVGSLVT